MDAGGLTTGYMTWSNQEHAMPVPENWLISELCVVSISITHIG